MKRNVLPDLALSIGGVLGIMLGFLWGDIRTGVEVEENEEEKLTVDESLDRLLVYIYELYDDRFPYTKYETYQEGEAPHIFAGYPAYEFDLPWEKWEIRQQIICSGESVDKEYFILSHFSWNYYYDENGDREYINANFISNFAVNRSTKKVVQERAEDAGGMWIYNCEFPEWEQVDW